MAKSKMKLPGMPESTIPNKSVAVKNAAIEAAKPVPQIHIEGVACDSIEAGHKHLYEFAQRKDMGRYNYAFLMEEEDGTLKLVERLSMPCWGAIREYGCGTRSDDYWPTDLREPRHIFPATGNPIAISFQFNQIFNSKDVDKYWNKFITEFVFNAEVSPWRTILKDYELILVDDLITGVLFKDTKIDPTVLAHMMKFAGRAYNGNIKYWNQHVDAGIHPLTAWAYLHRGVTGRIVPEHFFLGQPPDFSNGKTFYERESYNRPDVEKLFGGKDNVGIPCVNMSMDGFDQLRISVMENDNG